MSAGANTPFIPPLTPGAMQATPLPSEPPVIPGQPPGTAIPGWGAMAQHAGSYPGGYPRTPYTAATPYLPGHPGLPMGGAHTPGSGQVPFLPSSPVYPPLLQRPVVPHPHDSAVSSDYVGYPSFPDTPAAPPVSVIPASPATPPTVASAPPQILPPASMYWQRPPAAAIPYQPFGQPMSAGPYPPFQYPPQMHPAWMGATPAVYPTMNLDPYAGMTWHQPAGVMMHPQSTAPSAVHHHHPSMQLPQHLAGGGGTPAARVGDRMPPFTAGRSYGPVLDPFLLPVVGTRVKLNPLLEPLPENGEERVHLKWNMLFKTNNCQRSTDPVHISWSKGRDEPATFPRLSKMTLISEKFPWVVIVNALDPEVGVTCGDLIDALSDDLHKLTSAADYNTTAAGRKQQIGEAYRFNRSRAAGVPGGRLGDGLRRMDFLARDVMFGGVYNDDKVLKKVIGVKMPGVFVVKCLRQYAMTPEEVRDHEARERANERANERQRMQPTVESVSDTTADDDDD